MRVAAKSYALKPDSAIRPGQTLVSGNRTLGGRVANVPAPMVRALCVSGCPLRDVTSYPKARFPAAGIDQEAGVS
jgi:hypothetical protein